MYKRQLVIIVILGSELFTGNCFTTMIPVYGKKLKFRQIIPMWIVCYFGNFVGIALVDVYKRQEKFHNSKKV